ncbi:SHOCT domain-containing protein [Thermopolyspora sp. NPDC052614]|uniref:SHOCT domain-containing protein n=1 Tax=Thermopolyspora sp. NPDC052614 TaxID=3155682 RepID=UPI0034293C2E
MRLLLIAALVIALLAAISFGMAWLSRKTAEARRPAAEDPREILKRRYAAGEIDEDEYLRRMSGLSQDW